MRSSLELKACPRCGAYAEHLHQPAEAPWGKWHEGRGPAICFACRMDQVFRENEHRRESAAKRAAMGQE